MEMLGTIFTGCKYFQKLLEFLLTFIGICMIIKDAHASISDSDVADMRMTTAALVVLFFLDIVATIAIEFADKAAGQDAKGMGDKAMIEAGKQFAKAVEWILITVAVSMLISLHLMVVSEAKEKGQRVELNTSGDLYTARVLHLFAFCLAMCSCCCVPAAFCTSEDGGFVMGGCCVCGILTFIIIGNILFLIEQDFFNNLLTFGIPDLPEVDKTAVGLVVAGRFFGIFSLCCGCSSMCAGGAEAAGVKVSPV